MGLVYTREDVLEYNQQVHFEEITLRDNVLIMNVLDENKNSIELKLEKSSELVFYLQNQELGITQNDGEIRFEGYPMNLLDANIEKKR